VGAHARGNGLLTGVEVDKAGQFACTKQFGHLVLEHSDLEHGLIHLDHLLFGETHFPKPPLMKLRK
jgi:hypothetical protein